MSSEIVGTVAGLWRFPVKSMKGEAINEAELTTRGLVGDRAYALIDADTGKVVSAKSVKLFPQMLNCRAEFVESPKLEGKLPPVRITLPNNTTTMSDSMDASSVLSSFFGRNVRLAQSAPTDFTIDMYHPDVEGVDPKTRDTVVEQKLGSALFAEMGLPSAVPVGAFFDLFPLSVITNSSLNRLNELQPQSRFDQRRFRMNVVLNVTETGFVENTWIGRDLAIGDARVRVAVPDSRCVMTTLSQDELPKDVDILKALAKHNRIPVATAGEFPCLGVYAVVQSAGRIKTGDRAALT